MSRRIATLNSSDRKSSSGSNSSSTDDDKRQQGFFVGGSEHSGQQVLGPESSRGREDIVSHFFNSARAHGAAALSPEENARLGTHNAMKFASGSRGYRLGDAMQPSESVELTAEPNTNNQNFLQQDVALVMWENGFTVDGGPLRRYTDPPNQLFLDAIAEGRIPSEIIRQYPGKTVDIRMERRREPYVQKLHPFSGQGQRLGELVPNFIGAGVVGQKVGRDAEQANIAVPDSESVKKAQEAVKLVEGEPVTQVQIRLPDGGRIVGRFNHNHTVQDVRAFLVNAAPEYAFHPFNLMTTFPSKVIEQENISLQEADLLNAVVVARLV